MKDLSWAKLSKKGGESTKTKYGHDHYSNMGRKSHEARVKKYGADYYRQLNKKSQEAKRKKKDAITREKESPITQLTSLLSGKSVL